ncbi:MAG: SH3 domain-containing protein [Lachnospiraceae bacterium]|nr:SH3 domain-containing protein [Lachnospiraceae bacterium]
MLKRYLLEIEIAVIVILVFLLCLKFQKKAERNEKLADGEHRVVEISEDGVVRSADGRVYFPTGYVQPGEATPTVTPSPTPAPLSETERRLAALTEEQRARYNAAVNFEIPSGIAFAHVEESLSIREKASGESKQIGVMYPNNYCVIQSTEGEWAKVKTGNITGYCRVAYLITGDEAVRIARETVVCKATTTGNVNIRSSATTQESNVVGTAERGKTYVVLEPVVFSDDPDAPMFCKVQNGSKVSYIALGKVTISYGWTPGKAK